MQEKMQEEMACGTCRCIRKKPSPLQIVVERTCDSVSEIITKYRRKIRCEARQMVRQAKCKECGNLVSGRCNFDQVTKGQRGFAWRWASEEIGVGVLMALLAIFLLAGLYFVRRYNHTFAYGAGGCVSTIFWTYDECLIAA